MIVVHCKANFVMIQTEQKLGKANLLRGLTELKICGSGKALAKAGVDIHSLLQVSDAAIVAQVVVISVNAYDFRNSFN